MSKICNTCAEDIDDGEKYLECEHCQCRMHLACQECDETALEILKKITAVTLLCEVCKQEASKSRPLQSSRLLNLPDEILLQVFSYFSDDTAVVRKILAPVCQKFFSMANDAEMLRKLQFYGYCHDGEWKTSRRSEKFCDFLLSLDKQNPSSEILSNANTFIINLCWDNGIVEINDIALWATLWKKLHRLQTLQLVDADLCVENFFSTLSSSLTHLHLVKCKLADDIIKLLENERFLPELKCLHIDERWICINVVGADNYTGLLQRSPLKLEYLYFSTRESVSSKGMCQLLANATNLKSLHVNLDCLNTGEVMRSINACSNLEYLQIDDDSCDETLKPSDLALLRSNTGLVKLKGLTLQLDPGSKDINIEDMFSLCQTLGPSVEMKVLLSEYSGDRYQDWTSRKNPHDNLHFSLGKSCGPVCNPS